MHCKRDMTSALTSLRKVSLWNLLQSGTNTEHLAPKGCNSFLSLLLLKNSELSLIFKRQAVFPKVYASSWEVPLLSSHKTSFKTARKLQLPNQGLHWQFAQKLSSKRLQMFSVLHVLHIHTSATWMTSDFATQLSWLLQLVQFSEMEKKLHDFFLLAKLPLPSCGRIRFFLLVSPLQLTSF